MTIRKAKEIIQKAKQNAVNEEQFELLFNNTRQCFVLIDKKSRIAKNFFDENELKERLTEKYCNYAILYHSKMTDIEIYFTSQDKQTLEKFDCICRLYIDTSKEEEKELAKEILLDNFINIYNIELDEENFEHYEIIKTYSYRF